MVGAGHNGLVAACYLARAGLKVQVAERNPYIGGAAVSRQLYENFTYSNCSYVCSLLRPEIMREFELPRFGLQIIPYDGGCTMMRDGGHLAVYDNHDAMRRELARHSKRDAEAYDRYTRDLIRQCKFINPLLLREPPRSHIFQAARRTDRSPLELGLEWLVDFDKGHFTGRRALLAQKRRELRRLLVGLDIAGNKPAGSALLYADDGARRQIGSISSAIWSPTCKRNNALAMVDAPYFEIGTSIWADIYLCRELVWERRMRQARVVPKPFFAPERRRATPPGDF